MLFLELKRDELVGPKLSFGAQRDVHTYHFSRMSGQGMKRLPQVNNSVKV